MLKLRRRKPARAKKCFFCEKNSWPDYKDPEGVASFLTSRERLLPRSTSGLCRKHQRALVKAIKRDRFLALLPFASQVK